MNHEDRERIGRNEAIFRDVNEAIRNGRWPGDGDPVAFRCECARLGCTELIELDTADYEAVRAHPRRFVIAVGHEHPEAERVISLRGGYAVIEKHGEAAAVAEELDPRS